MKFNERPEYGMQHTHYDSLAKAIKTYETNNSLKLRILRSESLESYSKYSKKIQRRNYLKPLRYRYITYGCQFSPRCNFKLHFVLKENKLVLKEKIEHIKHSKFVLGNYKLETEIEDKIIFSLENHVNSGKLADKINKSVNNGVIIDPKLLNNRYKAQINTLEDGIVDDFIKDIKTKKELINIEVNQDKQITFYQNQYMKNQLACYSEMIFLDSTHKLLDTNQTVMFWFCINTEARTEVVLFAILPDEKAETIDSLFNYIKNNNHGMDVGLFMTDKDFVFRKKLKLYWEDSELMLCLFHVVRVLFNKLYSIIRNESSENKIYYLKVLKSVIYPKNSSEYYHNLRLLPEQYIIYFKKNWHDIKSQFIKIFIPKKFNLEKRTNNTSEGYFSKLKKDVKKNNKLNNFLFKTINYIDRIKEQRDNMITKTYLKNSLIRTKIKDSFIEKHFDILVLYSNFALRQIFQNYEKVNATTDVENEVLCRFCNFYIWSGLPCRHHIKHIMDNSADFRPYINKRWKKNFIYKTLQF